MSEKEYQSRLHNLCKLNPAEPLIPALRRGFLPINVLYLRLAEKRLPSQGDDPETEQLEGNSDETLRGLWAERTRLFGLMNKQSNQFHQCTTVAQRRENSEKIVGIWSDILAVKAKIQHYQQHGEVPIEEEEPLPDNPVKLALHLNSIRAQISKCRSGIRLLAQQGADKAKIEAVETRLSDWLLKKSLAEAKMKIHGTEEN